MKYFEDIALDVKRDIGIYTFAEEEMIRFARQFDPQPFHLDLEAARASHFGGLVASGWHTVAVWMKLMVADRIAAHVKGDRAAFGPSPGFRDLKWLKPVYAGDTLTYSTMATEKVELKSRPHWGLIYSLNEAVNQKGEPALSFLGQVLCLRRPA
jgi:acyl dehydratase